jgi:hypothetical protein
MDNHVGWVQGGHEFKLEMMSNARTPSACITGAYPLSRVMANSLLSIKARKVRSVYKSMKTGGLRGRLKEFMFEHPLPLHPAYS